MKAAWYHVLLDKLRQIPDKDGERGDSEEVIDLGGKIKGVYQHKLRHWFGPKTDLIKVPVPTTEDGFIDWESLDFDPNGVTATWAKPGSGDNYVLTVDGHVGRDFEENFKRLGLIAEPGPKLFKRLKRAFGVMTIGSSRDFNYRIITDDSLAPEKLTDGMAFANSKFVSYLARRPITHGDVFQYSMLCKDGFTKGSLVAMDDLKSDVVIPGTHNVKTELRSMGKRLFCIEGFQEPKIARTDMQTMIHCDLYPLFEDQFYAELLYLTEIVEDTNFLAKVFWEEFESEDYFKKMWERFLRQRDHNPKAEMPDLEYKPRLTTAHEMEIDPRVSPTLMRDFIKWCCARVNINKMQVPIENSCAGYIIPDLSQFDPESGEFAPDPNTVLRCNQIAFPESHLEFGPVAVIRQPNGLGEALVTNNVPAKVKSQGVQMSPLACDPELSKVYGLPNLGFSALELHGGADMDDRVIGIANPAAVTIVHKKMQELKKLDLPKSNLEDLVDASQQTSKAPWTVAGQLDAALARDEMDLGSAVNFMMALALVEDWEFYRYAATSANALELSSAQEQYLNPEDKDGKKVLPRYPDCWLPQDEFEYDPHARLPVEDWGSEETPFMYYEVEEVTTRCGELMEECGHAMDLFLTNVFEHKDIDQKALINTIEGTKLMRSCITREGKEGVKIGLALWAVYLKLTGRDPKYTGTYESLVGSYDVIPFESDLTIQDKQREFGVVVNQLFAGRTEAERLAATAQFALNLLEVKDKRWHGPEDARRPLFNAYGNDSWLFTPSRNEDYSLVMADETHLEPGLMHYWTVILKKFCNEYDL